MCALGLQKSGSLVLQGLGKANHRGNQQDYLGIDFYPTRLDKDTRLQGAIFRVVVFAFLSSLSLFRPLS